MARLNSPVFLIMFIACLSFLRDSNSSAVIQLLLHKVHKPKPTALGEQGSKIDFLTTPPRNSHKIAQNLPMKPEASEGVGLTANGEGNPLAGLGKALSDLKPRDLKNLANKERNGWRKLPIKPSDGESNQDKADNDNGRTGSDQSKESSEPVRHAARPALHPMLPKRFPLKNSGGAILLFKLPRKNIKNSWCHRHPFQQRIHHHGCNATYVNNYMCYGQCNSFFIPNNFVSCSQCVPSTRKILNVELKCPGQTPDVLVKRVAITESCDCRPCNL